MPPMDDEDFDVDDLVEAVDQLDEDGIDSDEPDDTESPDAALDARREDQDPAQEQRRPSRGEQRIQRLAREAREAREKQADLERQLNELRQERLRAAPPPVDPQAEARMLADMDPDTRLQYQLTKAQEQNQRMLADMQRQNADMMDRMQFDQLVASNPKLSRHVEAAEAMRQREMAKSGGFIPRHVALKFYLGEQMLANQNSPGRAKQKAAAQERVRRQTVTPSDPRGQVGRGSRGGKSLEDRLADVSI